MWFSLLFTHLSLLNQITYAGSHLSLMFNSFPFHLCPLSSTYVSWFLLTLVIHQPLLIMFFSFLSFTLPRYHLFVNFFLISLIRFILSSHCLSIASHIFSLPNSFYLLISVPIPPRHHPSPSSSSFCPILFPLVFDWVVRKLMDQIPNTPKMYRFHI